MDKDKVGISHIISSSSGLNINTYLIENLALLRFIILLFIVIVTPAVYPLLVINYFDLSGIARGIKI